MRRTITIRRAAWLTAKALLTSAGFNSVTAHTWRYDDLTHSLTGVLIHVEHEAHRTMLAITTPTKPNAHDNRTRRAIIEQLTPLKADAPQRT